MFKGKQKPLRISVYPRKETYLVAEKIRGRVTLTLNESLSIHEVTLKLYCKEVVDMDPSNDTDEYQEFVSREQTVILLKPQYDDVHRGDAFSDVVSPLIPKNEGGTTIALNQGKHRFPFAIGTRPSNRRWVNNPAPEFGQDSRKESTFQDDPPGLSSSADPDTCPYLESLPPSLDSQTEQLRSSISWYLETTVIFNRSGSEKIKTYVSEPVPVLIYGNYDPISLFPSLVETVKPKPIKVPSDIISTEKTNKILPASDLSVSLASIEPPKFGASSTANNQASHPKPTSTKTTTTTSKHEEKTSEGDIQPYSQKEGEEGDEDGESKREKNEKRYQEVQSLLENLPTEQLTRQTSKEFWFTKGKLKLSISLNQGFYFVGQTLVVVLNFENSTTKSIKLLTYKLRKEEKMFCGEDSTGTKQTLWKQTIDYDNLMEKAKENQFEASGYENLKTSMIDPGVSGMVSGRITNTFILPEREDLSTLNGTLISRSLYIRIICSLDFFFSNPLKLSIPITVLYPSPYTFLTSLTHLGPVPSSPFTTPRKSRKNNTVDNENISINDSGDDTNEHVRKLRLDEADPKSLY